MRQLLKRERPGLPGRARAGGEATRASPCHSSTAGYARYGRESHVRKEPPRGENLEPCRGLPVSSEGVLRLGLQAQSGSKLTESGRALYPPGR